MFSPHAFSRAWRQLHLLASNSDWLIVLFTSVAIGQSNYFVLWFWFYDTQLETALCTAINKSWFDVVPEIIIKRKIHAQTIPRGIDSE